MTSPFIAPRYELPLVDQASGRITPEWYKFFVPLAKKAVSTEISITTTAPLAGGATLADDITLSISNNGITNALLAKMATHTIKGNSTGSTANAQDLTGTDITALLDVFTSSLKGLAPLSGGGNNNLLRSDGTWTNSVDASFSAGTYLKTGSVLVADLPSAVTVAIGTRYFVSDATVTTFASVVAGTGANKVPVYSDGAAWRIG